MIQAEHALLLVHSPCIRILKLMLQGRQQTVLLELPWPNSNIRYVSRGLLSPSFVYLLRPDNVTVLQGTVLMALLQPAPEVFELFDDILLMAEGHVIFHGPKEDVLPFFEGLGFKLPARKGIGDFLQEVTTLSNILQELPFQSNVLVAQVLACHCQVIFT